MTDDNDSTTTTTTGFPPAAQAMLDELTDMLDTLCWDVRDSYGHADNGLEDFDTGDELDVHPEAATLARFILAGMIVAAQGVL